MMPPIVWASLLCFVALYEVSGDDGIQITVASCVMDFTSDCSNRGRQKNCNGDDHVA